MITTRQKYLIEFLMNNSDTYISQYDISQSLPLCYFYDGTPEEFHDSKARQWLTADIRSINLDTSIEIIILSNSRGVKIANKEEFERGMKAEFAAIFRRLKRAYEKAQKGARNGQLEIDDNLNISEYAVFNRLLERGGNSGDNGK